jgi:hypothetical protein
MKGRGLVTVILAQRKSATAMGRAFVFLILLLLYQLAIGKWDIIADDLFTESAKR